jgi:hypothetical protein
MVGHCLSRSGGEGRYGRKFVNFNGWMTLGKADTCVEDDVFHAGGKLILSSDSDVSWATVFL